MNKYRPITERIHDFKPVEPAPEEGWLKSELARCQDCGIPFCHACGCPLLNAIPEINAAAREDRWNTALARLLATSPFPEFTARVCPALCEGSCVQGLNESGVPCRQVEFSVIERGFAEKLLRPRPPARRLEKRAVVVGSGPAGLAAAWRLNRAGLRVTVYERDARPGGFLRYGIPDFKLEKSVLDRRISLLEEEGIIFECGVEAGEDISGRLLSRRNDILILATGARKKRDLPIPGRELSGIHFAVDYLTAQNRLLNGEIRGIPSSLEAGGKRVIVIGGGDTGSDCVGTAWRQGAVSVCQLEILPKPPETRSPDNPWPEWPRVLRTSSSHEEGGERRWSVTAGAFIPAEGNPSAVGAVRCSQVKWVAEGGRQVPLPDGNSAFTLPADLVLLAMGFTGTEPGQILSSFNLAPDKSGRLPRDGEGRLSLPGLYACGDAALGPSLVVRAIADGLRVAERALEHFTFQAGG
ncbi:MAG: glutamate synthase subunit beta [Deltaproteobacteria bacterium]|jgi:glutamate synthase (NADPH/NADH) small chain|nr:glutamate synthase subunit beta [Deltaproteobacteria bacterium]